MKILLILLIVSHAASCQSSEEWFNQKETQKKYLQQQVTGLRTYSDYARKGYSIASKGLTTVRDIKNGDFDLHRDFLHSFQRVNPAIKDYSKVADIINLQLIITRKTKEILKGANETNMFSASELKYCSSVIKDLLNSCSDNIEELILVISDGELEMSDDGRLKRVEALYTDMQDKVSFCSSFSEEMALLTVQRMRELKEVKISQLLNGLK